MLQKIAMNFILIEFDLCTWFFFLQNYSPQYDSYDVKSGVGGGMGGFPGPAVCTNVSEHVQVSPSICFLTLEWCSSRNTTFS